ncbi:OLC1v1032262C1 [Oldenlandia corymbosa var. corymbosa]|uniref:OLC1v1032262C1 n=1 Tax=Oldenlandia corymbosa var. corymbosa TaxID=529605 RepID=A0AAV1CNR9_OLDCO|nr:OLC1v1032262C1 [Oldenlandia corymbosa var. corymbosa]
MGISSMELAVNDNGSGKKMMVAIDESETSYYALIWVLENLQESIAKSSNPLVLFMAQPPAKSGNLFGSSPGSARIFFNASPDPEFSNAVQERDRMISVGILEKAKSICNSYGICLILSPT